MSRTNERTNGFARSVPSVIRWDYLLGTDDDDFDSDDGTIDRSIATTTTTDRGDGDGRSRAGVFACDRRRRERVVVVKHRPSSRPSGRLHPRVWIEKYLSVVYPVFDRARIIARVRRIGVDRRGCGDAGDGRRDVVGEGRSESEGFVPRGARRDDGEGGKARAKRRGRGWKNSHPTTSEFAEKRDWRLTILFFCVSCDCSA